MRRFLLTVVSALPLFWGGAQAQDEMRKIKVYDGVVFYDGYLMDKNPDKDLDGGGVAPFLLVIFGETH